MLKLIGSVTTVLLVMSLTACSVPTSNSSPEITPISSSVTPEVNLTTVFDNSNKLIESEGAIYDVTYGSENFSMAYKSGTIPFDSVIYSDGKVIVAVPRVVAGNFTNPMDILNGFFTGKDISISQVSDNEFNITSAEGYVISLIVEENILTSMSLNTQMFTADIVINYGINEEGLAMLDEVNPF